MIVSVLIECNWFEKTFEVMRIYRDCGKIEVLLKGEAKDSVSNESQRETGKVARD